MSVEHSEQAKAAYPNSNGLGILRNVQLRTAFDRGRESMQQLLAASLPSNPGRYFDRAGDEWTLSAHGHWIDKNGETRPVSDNWMIAVAVAPLTSALAERRITDRETLEKVIWQHVGLGRSTNGDDVSAMADAILALPSTPITSTREVIKAVLLDTRIGNDDIGVWLNDDEAEQILAALAASGLVKDNGDAPDEWVLDPSGLMGGYVCSVCKTPVESEPCEEHQPREYAGMEPITPVDRLAVIREVIDWIAGGDSSPSIERSVRNAREHFGIATVEEDNK